MWGTPPRRRATEPGVLTVGTRGSALALAQTQKVVDLLRRGRPDLEVRVEQIRTTGDVRRDVPLAALGRGAFVSEIESALREGRVDVAVHSAKDLPSLLGHGLRIAAVLERADPRDVLVSRHDGGLRGLPVGARVGTGSPRRACQLRAMIERCHDSQRLVVVVANLDRDRALRDRAKREGRSLDEVAVEALARGVGVANGDVLFHDLDHLIGTWVEDPEFDAIIAEQRQVDPELWR
jgi:hypothetical protein